MIISTVTQIQDTKYKIIWKVKVKLIGDWKWK